MGVAIFIFGAPSLCSGRQIGVGYLHIWCSLAKLGTTNWGWLSSYLCFLAMLGTTNWAWLSSYLCSLAKLGTTNWAWLSSYLCSLAKLGTTNWGWLSSSFLVLPRYAKLPQAFFLFLQKVWLLRVSTQAYFLPQIPQ